MFLIKLFQIKSIPLEHLVHGHNNQVRIIELEDGPEYEVVVILDSKMVRNKLYDLVDWLG